MQLAIVIVVVVVVLAAVVLFATRTWRSRTERTDWIGELSEIRRSSLGDDEEVTGAIEAVTIVDGEPSAATSGDGTATDEGAVDPATDDVEHSGPPADAVEDSGGRDPEQTRADGSDAPSVAPHTVTDRPTRTVTDAGTLFNEYGTVESSRLRVEITDPAALRVVTTGPDRDGGTSFAVDLPRGVLWFRAHGAGACSVRLHSGWVIADGVLAVLADDPGWSYVMCVEGTASIRSRSGGSPVRLTAGQIGRMRVGEPVVDLVDLGVEAIGSEGVVRRQRRLDTADRQVGDHPDGSSESPPEASGTVGDVPNQRPE